MEGTGMNPTLDWRPNWDPRSAQFRFAALPMCANLRYRDRIIRTKSKWLDQGQEGACTGFGEEHVRLLSPYSQTSSNAKAREVYKKAQFLDEWPGEDYEGSSVNGAMKAAREMGLIKSWRWALSTVEAGHGLSYHGAGEMGSWWYSGMWEPDSTGFVHPTGSKVGGHAYAIAGYKYINGGRAYRIENSWGPSWGDNGGAWISEFDFASLLADDGELAFPVKVRF
jgi:hypothetical protein